MTVGLQRMIHLGLVAAVLAAGAAVMAAAVDGLPDPIEIRKAATPRVCLVQADGPLGLPEAYATGFLMGAGKFVITDLASLARPGVERVTIRFEGGKPIRSDKFGMADPTTGLVAVALEEPMKEPGGLSLSTAATTDAEGLPINVVGWRHGVQVNLTTGRVVNGVTAAEMAERYGVKDPGGEVTFLTLRSPAQTLAVGAPVLDAEGSVVGVMTNVAGMDTLLAVPAGALRSALLSAEPSLKPLSKLPDPIWPVTVMTLAGEPMNAQEYAGAVRAVKAQSRCDVCRGKGHIMVKKVVGHNRIGGMVRPIVRQMPRQCKKCGGDGIVCGKGLYDYFRRMAEGATRLGANPGTNASVLQAAEANTLGLLSALGKVGRSYREGLAQQAASDLGKGGGKFPRGVVVYAQRLETVREHGNQYTVLGPYKSSAPLVVPTDVLDHPLGQEKRSKNSTAGLGDWIVLAGLARGSVRVSGQRGVFVETFGWYWGPNLGGLPAHLRDSSDPAKRHEPRPPVPTKGGDGKPDFFGL